MEFRKHWKFYAVTMVLAALLFGFAVQSYVRTQALFNSNAFTTGTIVRINQPSGRLGVVTPVIHFNDGRSIVEVSNLAIAVPGGLQVGQSVPLMYDPQNPGAVRLGDPKQIGAQAYVLMLLGGVPALLFLLMFLHDSALTVESMLSDHKEGWPTAPPRPTPAM